MDDLIQELYSCKCSIDTVDDVQRILVSIANYMESNGPSQSFKLLHLLFGDISIHTIPLLSTSQLVQGIVSILKCIPLNDTFIILLDNSIPTGTLIQTIQLLLEFKCFGTLLTDLSSCTRAVRDKTIQTIVSLSDRVASRCNDSSIEMPVYLYPTAFLTTVLDQCMCDSPALPHLVSKLVMTGYGELIVQRCKGMSLEECSTQCMGTLVPMLCHLSMYDEVSILLKSSTHRSRVLYLLLQYLRCTTNTKVCDLLMEAGAVDVFNYMVNVWADGTETCESVASVLCRVMPLLPRETLLSSTQLSEGIQSRIESGDPQTLKVAMRVAKTLSNVTVPDYEFGGYSSNEDVPEDKVEDDFVDEVCRVEELDDDDLWEGGFVDEEDDVDISGELDYGFSSTSGSDPKALAIPVYPRQVLDYLRRGRKPEDHKYAEAALARILKSPIVTGDMTVVTGITQQLVSCTTIDMSKRSSAIQTLILTNPSAVTGYLTSQLPSKQVMISDKLMILEVLHTSAKTFLKMEDVDDFTFTSRGLEQQAPEGLVTDRKIGTVTRKGVMRKPGKTRSNRLTGICMDMYFPVLYNALDICTGLADELVLSRVLYTLASLLEYSSLALLDHSNLTRMSKELWQLLCFTRTHEASTVRRSCMFGVSRVLLACPSLEFTEGEDVMGLIDWLKVTLSSEDDKTTRDLASVSLDCLHDIFKPSITEA